LWKVCNNKKTETRKIQFYQQQKTNFYTLTYLFKEIKSLSFPYLATNPTRQKLPHNLQKHRPIQHFLYIDMLCNARCVLPGVGPDVEIGALDYHHHGHFVVVGLGSDVEGGAAEGVFCIDVDAVLD
jgi:hypothetical protein